MVIPFFDSQRSWKKIEPEVMAAIKRVLDSGKYILGKEGESLEQEFSAFIGAKYAIAVNSGTDALKIALRALGVQAGDEVITVANTAVPTVSAIRELGATPIFVDTDHYFTIDTSKIEAAITTKTRAIVPVHLYGNACDMDAIMKIAHKHKLIVVEDCAQSTGTQLNGKTIGSFGNAACFSFYPTKNLGAYGDGGMIVTNSQEVADTCRAMRMYGMKKTYFAEVEGWNSRMDEIQAAILRVKLPLLGAANERRREIAAQYANSIKNPKLILPTERPGAWHTYHLFVIRTADRDTLIKHLEQHSIGHGFHYKHPVHLQTAYEGLGGKKGDLPNTEKAADEIISLPIFPELTDAEVDTVIKALNSF
ncbi:MAG: DegT/DnrJ/EryC1/StrS family aminotransferase [Patescibacteria group bacterium]